MQAYCDLSLPDYTSKVINVGIQQGGIPDGVPEKMRQSTMENLQIFMDEDTQKEVQDSYVLDGDTYELKDGITGDKREELNDLLCKPLMMYTSFTSGSEESQKMLSQMQVSEGTDPMQVLSAMPEDAKKQMLEAADEKLSDMPESILTQAAVSGVKAEYEAMGEDLDAIQMNYIRTSGIQMVLMALVIMLAAVSVTFLSARVAAALGHDLRDNVYRKVIHFSSNEYHKFSTASLITRSTNDVRGAGAADDHDVQNRSVCAHPWHRRRAQGSPDRFLHDLDPWSRSSYHSDCYFVLSRLQCRKFAGCRLH